MIKKRRVQWAKQHKNDDFSRTVFTDEASFQLFRNTVRRWTKHPNDELKCAPKHLNFFQMKNSIMLKLI